MREEVLRMTHVTCRGQGSTPLRDLNLNIFAGEIMGLIPLNGGRGMCSLTCCGGTCRCSAGTSTIGRN